MSQDSDKTPLDRLIALLASTPSSQPDADFSYLGKLDSKIQTLLADYLSGNDVNQTALREGLEVSDSAEVLLDIYVIDSAEERAGQLETLGMRVVAFDDTYGMIEGWLPLDAVVVVAQLDSVKALMSVTAFGTDN
jgi:hypothetical protein